MNYHRFFLLPLVVLLFSEGCSDSEEPSYAGSGVIEATEVTLSAKVPGTILEFPLDNGMHVRTGDLVARIDVESIVLQRDVTAADLDDIEWNGKILAREIEAAREQVALVSIRQELTEKTLTRVANLYEQGAATADRLDTVETEVAAGTSSLRSAETRLEEAQTRLSALAAKRQKVDATLRLLDRNIADGTVTSPIEGDVIETYAEPGEMAMTGTPLVTVADLSTVRLRIYVGEELLGKIALGARAAISIDSHPGETFGGTVTWISPKAEFTPKNVQTRESRADLVYAVEITIPNPDGIFKIGMPADANIEGLDQ